jgi:positive phototaxis protein PixI
MKLPTLDPQSIQLRAIGDPYLKLQLTPQRAVVLPMEQAQEAIAVPANRVTPMPNMPACVLGLLNQKSRVIWAIDLAQLLGLQTQVLTLQQYNIAIIRIGKKPLGLVVPEINGIVRFASETLISPIGEVSPELTPYLRGCFSQGQEMLWALDPEAIINSPIFIQPS